MNIKVTKTGTFFSMSTDTLQHLRLDFDRQNCILFRQFLDFSLLELLLCQIEIAEFYEKIDKKEKTGKTIAVESCMIENVTTRMMQVLLNSTKLFRLIETITGCNRIGSFSGRLFRMTPDYHYDSWHDDLIDSRMIAMSINLSTESCQGSVLQIRDYNSKQIIHEVANTGLGDCIIFRIASSLEHRVTDLKGNMSRTTYAGWFKSQPEYSDMLKGGKEAKL